MTTTAIPAWYITLVLIFVFVKYAQQAAKVSGKMQYFAWLVVACHGFIAVTFIREQYF